MLQGDPSLFRCSGSPSVSSETIRLFFAGDVMAGRGIDQIFPQASDPRIYEPCVTDAREYVRLAEARNGPIAKPASYSYVWGDALGELQRTPADVRVVNLETSITTSPDYWKGKGINYRMHPGNVACLSAAAIDCCVVANNHILDWGYAGLEETLQSLQRAGIQAAGAARNREEAAAPAAIGLSSGRRVLVFAYASETSGTPRAWAATSDRPGLNLLRGPLDADYGHIAEHLAAFRRPGDIAVISIHWGSNWGYGITPDDKQLAHRLIDEAGADVVYGHSSHHAKGIEAHAGKLVLYGCGDFLNDYEGISGQERYRGDLSVMYFATLDGATGKLIDLEMIPMHIRKLRLSHASDADVTWLRGRLDRECRRLGGRVEARDDGRLVLVFPGS
jgi:poly-gamma-glutamate synthesis protein (capsule biosynthesis protein)